MPLKFLKKCRQYNVTSKSLFVISVHHLLDTSTTVDCTVSSESKGQECLDNVCNRLQIHQPEFFGLRYVVKDKDDELKWIDLERSLSRQLEKYANGTKIFLRVRHYVTTGVRHLSDESTRYYYFLQLKSDIYEGKIACDIRTSILLALYCRQAEYDSYQSDKQQQQLANEHLKRSLVLPKNLQGLCNDDSLLDSLIAEVLHQNPGIQHLTQSQAEEMYIQCCQQLEGYGEERFQAKDTLGNDLLLGLAINGIVVMAENGRQYFPWKDFHTVTIDKRTIKIEQNKNEVSIVGSFIFHEAETARYFWKLCVTQHKFFKRHIDEDNASVSGSADSTNGILPPMSTTDASNTNMVAGAAYAYDFNDSREDLLMEQQHQHQQRGIYNADYQAVQPLQQQQQMPHGSQALMSSNISLAASHQSSGGNGMGGHGAQMVAPGGAGIGGALSQNWLNKDYANDYISSQSHLSNSILDTRVQSSSCLDLSNNNLHSSSNLSHSNNNNNNHVILDERERLKAMLPTYRPAPDYETAVQLKYRASANELHNMNNLHYQSAVLAAAAAQQSAADPRLLHSSQHYYGAGGSQPDVHNAGIYAAGDNMLLSHLAPHRYPDVAQPAAALHAHTHHISANAAAAANSMNIYSNIELAQRMQMMRSKPPPPYPVNRLSSSSTPDLAVATHRPLLGYRAYVSGSSPDLVSNRNFLNSQYPYSVGGGGIPSGGGVGGLGVTTMAHQYPYMSHIGHSQQYLPPHGTFENLNMIEEQPSIMSQLRQSAINQAAATQQASQNYEQHSPTVPPTSSYRSPLTAATTSTASASPAPAALQRNAMNGSIEPIYENVPLPHYAVASSNLLPPAPPQRHAEHRSSSTSNSSDAMRNRTASIQSAPGGMQPPVPAARSHSHQHAHAAVAPPTIEPDEISMNIQKFGSQTHTDRAASTEHFLEPTAPQRTMRAASAAPAIGVNATQTPPPRHQHKVNLIKTSSVDMLQVPPVANNNTTTNTSRKNDDSLHHQFSAMNLSTASAASSTAFLNSSLATTNTTMDSSNSTYANNTFSSTASSNNTTKEGKRKKRWNILGRSKTPDKQKSATLGREKTSKTQTLNKIQLAQDDLNLPHRWSTGVPRLQPISGSYSKDKLSQILNDKLSDTQLFMEFERIPKRRESARYDCALMEENALKNSDPNFLPYDDNRVRITPTMENRHGYVNASHITATVGNKQRFYIVAQSPQQELTTRIFWQCVWEADVYLVVQLSDEPNIIPPNSNQRLEFGQFQVYQEFSQTTDRCVTSKLRLYHIQSRRYRSVWHLSYSDWAEQNCPRDVNHFLDFLEELNSVRMASINEVPPGHNTNPPVLIHCLEGGGRSGVTLTADLLLYTLDHNQDLDIPRVIGQLRHQRDSIIPSLAQYKFIYSLLITYLKRTRLI